MAQYERRREGRVQEEAAAGTETSKGAQIRSYYCVVCQYSYIPQSTVLVYHTCIHTKYILYMLLLLLLLLLLLYWRYHTYYIFWEVYYETLYVGLMMTVRARQPA